MPFRSIPVSRSRTSRSASASALLRPEVARRAPPRARPSSRRREGRRRVALVLPPSRRPRSNRPPRSRARRRSGPGSRRGGQARGRRRPRLEPGPHKQELDRTRAFTDAAAYRRVRSTTRSPASTTRGRASVVEDVDVLRRGGAALGRARWSSSRVGTGRIAVPIARERDRGDRRRLLGRGCSRSRARRRRAAGVEVDLRLGDLRDPPVEGHVPARDHRRSARCCTWRPTPTGAPRCARCTGCSSPAAGSSSTSSRPRPTTSTETHGRWLEREPGIFERADWDEDARTARAQRARRAAPRPALSLAWVSVAEWRVLLGEEGFVVEGLYGWFDRTPVGRARGLDLGLPAGLTFLGCPPEGGNSPAHGQEVGAG